VSFAALEKLRKKIRTDHDRALALWDSGNHDARILATMIADPQRGRASDLDRWIRDIDNYVLADALAKLAARSPAGSGRMEKWQKARRECRVTSAGRPLRGS